MTGIGHGDADGMSSGCRREVVGIATRREGLRIESVEGVGILLTKSELPSSLSVKETLSPPPRSPLSRPNENAKLSWPMTGPRSCEGDGDQLQANVLIPNATHRCLRRLVSTFSVSCDTASSASAHPSKASW